MNVEVHIDVEIKRALLILSMMAGVAPAGQLMVVGVVVVPRPLPPVHRLLGQRIRLASPRR